MKHQIPFLVGGSITGMIMTYSYGFLFTIIVKSAIWWGVSYFINKYYWKSKALDDQKYLLQFALAKFQSSRNKKKLI
ncbi:MAG: hypothetical protein M3044_17940 [Thermoproteota archaeon]|nr:hypothetical protein [Thermoproteota archaeon]